MLSMTAAALILAGCSEDSTTPTTEPEPKPEPPKVEIPTIALGDVVRNRTNDKVSVAVTPSESAEAWYWMLSTDGAASEYTAEHEAKSLEFDLEADVHYLLTVYAENSAGKSEEVTKEWSWSRAELQIEPVEVTVKNVSPFSMDVEVVTSSHCDKYVVMAMPTSALVAGKDLESRPYTDEEIAALITENGEMSLNPASNGGIQPYEVADCDAIFTERNLSKGGLRMNAETEYMVAVYALDNDGNAKIYRQNIATPKAEINGTANLDFAISELSYDHFTLQASGDESVSRIILGYIHENDGLNMEGLRFTDVADADMPAVLVSLAADIPLEYTGTPLTKSATSNIAPENNFLGYAMAIDKEGRVGEVVWEKFSTTAVQLDGTGSVTAVTIGEQVTTDAFNGDFVVCELPVTVTVKDAVALRLYTGTRSDYGVIGDDLERGMTNQALGLFTEYSAAELAQPIIITVEIPGSEYAMFASTVDANGKVSPIQNLVSIATDGALEFYPTTEVKKEVDTGMFGGTGELEYLNITELSLATASDMGTFIYEMKKGTNTKDVYWIPSVGIMTAEEIVAEVTAKFEGFPATQPNKNYKVNFNATTGVAAKRIYFDENYPHAASTTYIVVTVDNNDKIKIVYTYNSGNPAPEAFVE